jgi:glc operon protein GlcG
MRTKPCLELSDAEVCAAACNAAARDLGARVSIAVVDDAGALLHFSRRDGARPYSVDLAIRKARTAAALGLPTSVVEAMARERPLPGVDLLALAGGAPVMREGVCAGAVGISGSTSDVDHRLAELGAAAIDADAGTPSELRAPD